MLVTRFAPSPTGPLHIGHVFHLIQVLKFAQSAGAKVILRMEDHDTTRSKPEHTWAIMEQLKTWNLMSYFHWTSNQKNRFQRYEYILGLLQEETYYCQCSRKDILSRNNKNAYDGYCRQKGYDSGHVRLKLPGSMLDPILKNREEDFSYIFCNVIDDIDQSVTHAIRGQDIEHYTELQRSIFSLLGYIAPVYHHHDLFYDDSGKKISKRKKDSLPAGTIAEDSLQLLMNKLNLKSISKVNSIGDILGLTKETFSLS